ncbi:MAG: transglutaminase-like domain-containing protein [Opitutia bacterium]|jgi:regulator of sirC expression with transglutaminase-like and TPR domain
MAVSRDLSALERLLDDPSPVVREALISRVRKSGAAGIRWLRDLAAHPELGEHAREVLRRLGTPEAAAHALLAVARDPAAGLERGMVALERVLNPGLPEAAVSGPLDALAERARGLMVAPTDRRTRLRTLSRVIFGEAGFRGAEDSSDQPETSLISRVLERRRGNPLSLCAIYLLVARRLGIPLEPVGVPGRFMVGWFGEGEPIYVDAFAGGAFRTRDEIRLALRDNELPEDDAFLLPVGPRETLARACRNLATQHAEQGDAARAEAFASLAKAIAPAQPDGHA